MSTATTIELPVFGLDLEEENHHNLQQLKDYNRKVPASDRAQAILKYMQRLAAKTSDTRHEFWHYMRDNFFFPLELSRSGAINDFYKDWFGSFSHTLEGYLGLELRKETLAELKKVGVKSSKSFIPYRNYPSQCHVLHYRDISVVYSSLAPGEFAEF